MGTGLHPPHTPVTVTLPASVVAYLMPCLFSTLVTDGIACWRVLNTVREAVTLLSLTTRPSGWACGTWAGWLSFPKCRWLPESEASDLYSQGFWRCSVTEKSEGSESNWVSLINMCKLHTVLAEAKGQRYCSATGESGAPASPSQRCKQPLTCASPQMHKDGPWHWS